MGNVASALAARAEEASIVAELKAGSEDAYEWLIAHYHQPVYSLVYRILNDPADAADTTQEVFLKIFRGIKRFHGEASLKTWVYRIALHEACWRLAGQPTSWAPLAHLEDPAKEQDDYRQQLFDFESFVADGHGWMLVDPDADSTEGLRSRQRILGLLGAA